jgi:ferritin
MNNKWLYVKGQENKHKKSVMFQYINRELCENEIKKIPYEMQNTWE